MAQPKPKVLARIGLLCAFHFLITEGAAFAGGLNPDDTPPPPSQAVSEPSDPQLAEARIRAAQVRSEAQKLRMNVTQIVGAIRRIEKARGNPDAAYASLSKAVAAASPPIETNLAALNRIANALGSFEPPK